jgi:hypothetical protein
VSVKLPRPVLLLAMGLMVVALDMAGGLTSTGDAWAASVRWLAPETLGSGSSPVFALSPSGAATVAFSSGAGGPIELVGRPPGGQFSPAVTLAQSGIAQQVVLTAAGDTALTYSDSPGSSESGVSSVVKRPGASGFSAPQMLAPAGNNPPSVALAATTVGATIASINDSSGEFGVASLAAGAGTFSPEQVFANSVSNVEFVAPLVATDGSGGAFLAYPAVSRARCANSGLGFRGVTSAVGVAYRSASGRLSLATPIDCYDWPSTGEVGNVQLAATGHGRVMVADVYAAGPSGVPATRKEVVVHFGVGGRFGKPVTIASYRRGIPLLSGPPVFDSTGAPTLAWYTCRNTETGPCTVAVIVGTPRGRLPAAQTLRTRGHFAYAVTGVRSIALEDCPGPLFPTPSCPIEVSSADKRGRFQKPVQLAADGSIEAFVHDARGDQLLVWGVLGRTAARIYASAQVAGSNRFSPPRLLSSGPVDASSIAAQLGPRGEGIIAWKTVPGIVTADVVKIDAREHSAASSRR